MYFFFWKSYQRTKLTLQRKTNLQLKSCKTRQVKTLQKT